ncbi:MAG: glycosyltransferase family 4 protein [Cyanobacteria bacterium J06598_1]
MQILFLHPNFPAQFRHLLLALRNDPRHQVVFLTQQQGKPLANVQKVTYQVSRLPSEQTHSYIQDLEQSVLEGQAAYRRLLKLKETQGFYPDVIYAHSGWGLGLFMKDLFPKATYLCFCEWFYLARGSDADFDPADPVDQETAARLRILNASLLIDLSSCDRALSPTHWQKQQFPSAFHSKISVCHDGIDTTFFRPNTEHHKLVIEPDTPIACPKRLVLSEMEEVVTYVARGMEPYRGFPQFMAAVAQLQRHRPNCHVVIVGKDWVAYGKNLPNGKTYRQQALETLDLDLSRIHFTGLLKYAEYLQVLQASDVHVYLTYPFVLSWSMLEAMATGCVVVGSRTQPVEEVIQDGVNGLLVDFFQPERIVERVIEVLEHPSKMQTMRAQARQTIVDQYNLANLLPRHLEWIQVK